jgi:hypothetical protein
LGGACDDAKLLGRSRTAPSSLIDFGWTGILGGKHHANVDLAGLGALAAFRQEM